MKEFKVAMSTMKEMLWEAKHNFVVTFWWVASMSVSCLSISKLTCSRGKKPGAKRACGRQCLEMEFGRTDIEK